MTVRRFLPPLVVAITATVLVAVLHRPLAPLEDQLTSLKYSVRGEQPADTSIVLVYIDNEAVKSFGWPPRRSFHALMVKALNDLQVKAIGFEIQFENRNNDYPEYDDLLSGVVASANNVVLASYFQTVASPDIPQLLKRSEYPLVSDELQWGTEPHYPFTKLRRSAAGIGHVNLAGESAVPLFIASDSGVAPAFGLEMVRVFKGVPQSRVSFAGEVVVIPSEKEKLEFCSSLDNTVQLCYPGRASAFTAYPFLEVLKSYDALKSGGQTSVSVSRLKDKIVLIGAIAEGISDFRNTPVDPRYPSLALHAVFVDNALGSGFLRTPSYWLVCLFCGLLGFACTSILLLMPSTAGRIAAVSVIVLLVVMSFVFFNYARYNSPVTPILITGLIATISSLLYQHRFVREQVDSLQAEKQSIMAKLHDREAKLAVLERELLDFETTKSTDRTQGLLEEIQKYKAEIRSLSARADDMEEYRAVGEDVQEAVSEFEGIVHGSSGKLKPVIDFVAKIAGSDATVLILGESGTGKELIARAIHKRSPRTARQFVAVNCGALSESLLESELFGHEKGAFTGAVKERLGRFEMADGGTIFLDEVGDVSAAFQLRLLRVLQEGEFERVGGTKTLKVDVRVVAATNKNLKEAVRSGKFRGDLFYRLNVLTIELPPLRERQEDIPALVGYFLRREGEARFSKSAMEALRNYGWPGNVRELESAVKRGYLLAKADDRVMVAVKDLPEEISAALRGAVAVEQQILDTIREKRFSRNAVSETATELGGLNRGTVAEYLRGECLKAFVDNGFDLESAIKHISLTPDHKVNERVQKKLAEYLLNITEAVDTTQPWDATNAALKPKTKNLPQRYHGYLVKVAEAYYRGLWKPNDLTASA